MKTSVLIPAFQRRSRFAESLACLRTQAHGDWELIVVDIPDAGSVEALVRDFAAGAPCPVQFHALPTANLAAARNLLLARAQGEAIAFLEPGDVWTAHHLAIGVQHLVADADVVVSDIRLLDEARPEPRSEISPPAQLETYPTRALFMREAILSPSCAVFRRTIADRVGPFDLRFHLGEARDFWLRAAIAGAKFVPSHRATCQRVAARGEPVVDAILAAEEAVMFYEKHRDLPAVPSAMRRRLLAASLIAHGKLLRASDPAKAARSFWRAWSMQPVHVQTLGQFALTGWRSAPPPPEEPPAESARRPQDRGPSNEGH